MKSITEKVKTFSKTIILPSRFTRTLIFLCLALSHLLNLSAAAEQEGLCKEKKHAQLLVPKKGISGAYEVGVGIVPHSITKFNTKEGTADIDFYFTVEYELDKTFSDIKCVGEDAKDVWKIFYNPDIEFLSIPDPQTLQGFHWLVDKNRFVFMTRLKGTVVLSGDFRWFPFDRVTVPLRMQGEDDDRNLLLKPSKWYLPNYPDISKEMENLRISGWEIVRAEYIHKKHQWNFGRFGDGLYFEIEIVRKPIPFLVRAGLPLTLILIIALVSRRVLMKSEEAQLQVLSGLLVAIFAYSIYLNDRIPETDYITFGDFMWIGALLAIFSIIIGRMAVMNTATKPLRVRIEIISTGFALLIYLSVIVVAGYLLYLT